jgi:DNA-binding NtrC family response regulator
MTCVLIVEDDKIQRALLERIVSAEGFNVLTAADGAEALLLFEGPQGDKPDVVLLDLIMPVVSGREVLAKLKETRPSLPVIVLTSQSEVDCVVEVMRAGAVDFISKPPVPEKLKAAILNALERQKNKVNDKYVGRKASRQISFDDLAGNSEVMAKAVRMARKGAASNVPVLIEGESGVGKEVVARAIQRASDRAGKPFITVNCGAIPANLVESILFGHEKGAFTGASEKHDGKFQEANGGTLFLDEVGELPMQTQVKLLRAIQEGMVDPVGSRISVEVDVRLISATNKTLIEQVGRGEFREDLMYRLNVFPVYIPPLRQRREDIPKLVAYFTDIISKSENRPLRAVSSDAMTMLKAYGWPGNVRQLENAVFRAVIMADGPELEPKDFPQVIDAASKQDVKRPDQWQKPVLAHSNGSVVDKSQPVDDQLNMLDERGEFRPLSEVEAEMIEKALRHYNGHMSEIARRLGIGRSTLYRKITDLGFEDRLTMPQQKSG